MRSLFDRWFKERLEKVRLAYTHTLSPERFEASLKRYEDIQYPLLAAHLQANYDSTVNVDELNAKLRKKVLEFDRVSEIRSEMVSGYSRIYAHNQLALSDRWNEDWANSWDHFKTLLFRFTSGIMVVFLVLLTGYLSQLWSIPIPVLRVM